MVAGEFVERRYYLNPEGRTRRQGRRAESGKTGQNSTCKGILSGGTTIHTQRYFLETTAFYGANPSRLPTSLRIPVNEQISLKSGFPAAHAS
jgi:hypothetical protein